MASLRGDAYRISHERPEKSLGRGAILESWETKVMRDDFEAKQDFEIWFENDEAGIGFSFICADLIQEGSMSAPSVIGVFIPNAVKKQAVADYLRKVWGPGTQLRRPQ